MRKYDPPKYLAIPPRDQLADKLQRQFSGRIGLPKSQSGERETVHTTKVKFESQAITACGGCEIVVTLSLRSPPRYRETLA